MAKLKKRGGGFNQRPRLTAAQAVNKLFGARSRRTFLNQPMPNVQSEEYDPHEQFRLAFAVYFEVLDFAGSLLGPGDKLTFTKESGTFYELYTLMNHYKQHMLDQYPAAARESLRTYISDIGAGGYDLVDAFLNIKSEYRPQLLEHVKRFRNGFMLLDFYLTIPEEMFNVPDAQSPLRLYAQYCEKGYRIVQTDSRERHPHTLSGFKELELMRMGNAFFTNEIWEIVASDDENVIPVEKLKERAKEMLHEISAKSDVTAVGIVLAPFAMNYEQLEKYEGKILKELAVKLGKPNAMCFETTVDDGNFVDNSNFNQKEERTALPAKIVVPHAVAAAKLESGSDHVYLTAELLDAIIKENSGHEHTFSTGNNHEIHIGQGQAYMDRDSIKKLFHPSQYTKMDIHPDTSVYRKLKLPSLRKHLLTHPARFISCGED
jgi:hypothetical protein